MELPSSAADRERERETASPFHGYELREKDVSRVISSIVSRILQLKRGLHVGSIGKLLSIARKGNILNVMLR